MAIIEQKFSGVKSGQVFRRRRSPNTTSPHILVLAVGTRFGCVVPCLKARTYNASSDVVGSTTVYPYLENMKRGYEYVGVLMPFPQVGMKLERSDGEGHFKVTAVSATHATLIDWDKRGRKRVGTKVHRFSLGPTFWHHVDVFWPKKKKQSA